MMSKFLRLLILLVLATGARYTSAQSVSEVPDTLEVSLESAISRALELSPDILATDARRVYAGARHDFARSYRILPNFEATSAHSTAPGLKNDEGLETDALYLDPDVRNDWDDLSAFNRVEVEIAQPILTWGELSGNISAAKHGIAVEEASVQSSRLDVALRTGRLYYGVLLAEALRRLAREAENIVQQAIDEIESQLDEGATDVDDADLFQVQIAEQEVIRRVVEVEQQLRTARAALGLQLVLPEGIVADGGARILEVLPYELAPLDEYQRLALTRRPEIAQASAGLAAREALVTVAKSDFYPKLFLAANARYSYAADRHRQRNPFVSDPFLSRSVQAGLGFRQNLNFAQTGAKVEQARAEASEVRFQGEAARLLVRYEVEQAYRNVIAAQAAVDTGGESLRLSREWLLTEQVNFDYELGDTENLVDAVKSNLELQATQNQAVFDYNMAVMELLHATGTLTDDMASGTLVE